MIDVGELMADPDFAKCFTVKRPTGGFTVDGIFTASYDELDFVGIVQPAQPAEIQMLPEGSRLGNIVSVWSADEIRGSDTARQESDVLVVDGDSYRVIKVEPRGDNGYTRVFAEGFAP